MRCLGRCAHVNLNRFGCTTATAEEVERREQKSATAVGIASAAENATGAGNGTGAGNATAVGIATVAENAAAVGNGTVPMMTGGGGGTSKVADDFTVDNDDDVVMMVACPTHQALAGSYRHRSAYESQLDEGLGEEGEWDDRRGRHPDDDAPPCETLFVRVRSIFKSGVVVGALRVRV